MIDNNWWDAADLKISQAISADIEMTDLPRRKAVLQQFKINKLIETLEREVGNSNLSPAFRWAQSGSQIFLEIKFSHRFDTPGCLEINDPKVVFEKNKLLVTGSCAISGIKFKGEVNIDFWDEIDPAESTYNEVPVGRIQLWIKKADSPKKWPKLYKGKTKPKNMIFWWDMQDQYIKELEALEDD